MPKISVIVDKKIIGENHRLTIYEPDNLKYSRPILAIHGMWATNQRWDLYGLFFSRLGFRFLAPSLRHHFQGNNIPELGKTSINDYIADVAHLIENINNIGLPGTEALPLPIIFGHSMGGLIAQKLASQHLASKVVLLNSAPPAGVNLPTSFCYKLAVLRYLPKMFFKKPFKPSLRVASRFLMNTMPEDQWRRLYRGLIYESGQAAWEIKSGKIMVDFESINCPVLIIGCKKDQIVPCKVALDIGKKMRHFDYDVWILDQFAHWIQLEPGWEEAANHIFEWIKKNPPR